VYIKKSQEKLKDHRSLAVDSHNNTAQEFAGEYRSLAEHDYFVSAFLFGRGKIDSLLYSTLDKVPKTHRVLDIGCGTGNQIHLIRKLGFEVSGIEPAENMRALAKDMNPEVEILDGDIFDLPFEDHTFDFILALEVLRYLDNEDILESYRQMLRVLRPGGIIFFTMVNRFALDGYYCYEKVMKLLGRLGIRPQRAHCEFVTPTQVRNDLDSLGFSDVKTFGRLFLPIRLAYKLNLSLGQRLAKTLNSFDDVICKIPSTASFAGHLIVIARRGEI
jgi:SAM-dependent methyltransferase